MTTSAPVWEQSPAAVRVAHHLTKLYCGRIPDGTWAATVKLAQDWLDSSGNYLDLDTISTLMAALVAVEAGTIRRDDTPQQQ